MKERINKLKTQDIGKVTVYLNLDNGRVRKCSYFCRTILFIF